MLRLKTQCRTEKIIAQLFLWMFVLLLVAVPDLALARHGGDSGGERYPHHHHEHRHHHRQVYGYYSVDSNYYGIVDSRPYDLLGQWVIGGTLFIMESGTRFDMTHGPLLLGTCAKVRVGDYHVREIQSKPLSYCQKGH
jgi:hypothetical protein